MNKTEIVAICKQLRIENYIINDDGTIDVDGDVDLSNDEHEFTELPLSFNIIRGSFNISGLGLTTLLGCPKIVCGDFICKYNLLSTLEHSPTDVWNNYRVENNSLTSLVGAPVYIHGNFFCCTNLLSNLEGAPLRVKGDFYCCDNNLTNLIGSPRVIGRDMHIGHNALINLIGCPKLIEHDLYMSDSIPSLYTNDVACIVKGKVNLINFHILYDNNRLPQIIIDNHENLAIILKYQSPFEIWNEDLTFNQANFDIFIHEINTGLL
jgi:hypothetical protein